MKTLTFLTLLLITSSSAVGQTMQSNKTGFVGKDVLLSCNCSNELNELVWQNGVRIVNAHSKEEINIDVSYKDRTQLFLTNDNRNCSLLIRNISTEDAGVYSCHALASVDKKVYSRKTTEVILTVSPVSPVFEREEDPEKIYTYGKSGSAVFVGVPICVIALLLAVGLLLTKIIRRHHRTSTNTGSEEPMLEKV